MLKFIIRLDDACENMYEENWIKIETILDKYNIKPIVGIIPDNKDNSFKYKKIVNFWNKYPKTWEKKGWIIAQHGFQHKYHYYEKKSKRIRTEFYGVEQEKQRLMIEKGLAILKSHDINPICFFAPNHTFDNNTIEAIKNTNHFLFISDGVAQYPFVENGMLHIPNIYDTPHKILNSGVFTFVFHPNNINEQDLFALENFIIKHLDNFNVDINFIINYFSKRKKNIIDNLLFLFINIYRKMKGNNKNE